ncbi:MAG: tyrosine-type recombinase/integrase [Promethearchaeota archaeon]
MDSEKLNGFISKYINKLKSSKNNIEQYYLTKLTGKALGTQLNHLQTLNKLFETDKQRNMSGKLKLNNKILENTNVDDLTKENILDLLRSKWYKSLKPQSQELHINRIKQYLRYSKRKDLEEILNSLEFKNDSEELSKIDLITRDNLNVMLKFSAVKGRALIMVLYEGALRRDELLSIQKKHIQFLPGYAILKVSESKTVKRDIPLVESIPYLKEYFYTKIFEPNDLIFPYKSANFLNIFLNGLKVRISKKYPEWKSKKLYPHLFRHSRLTELAKSRFNEAQIRKFAGWKADSSMAKVYFHLDDSDIIGILTDDVVEKPKPKKIKIINCPICTEQNSEQNTFCWKCNNILNEEKRKQAGIQLISQTDEIKELKNNLANMDNSIKLLEKYIFHQITKDKYPDLELSDDVNLTNILIDEYNKNLEK